eukprot:1181440-Prorocentrum_minimum.AAC.6
MGLLLYQASCSLVRKPVLAGQSRHRCIVTPFGLGPVLPPTRKRVPRTIRQPPTRGGWRKAPWGHHSEGPLYGEGDAA